MEKAGPTITKQYRAPHRLPELSCFADDASAESTGSYAPSGLLTHAEFGKFDHIETGELHNDAKDHLGVGAFKQLFINVAPRDSTALKLANVKQVSTLPCIAVCT